MSAEYIAKCSCGYSKTFIVGGLMKTFKEFSEFPFLCHDCGLISVNIKGQDLSCPSCLTKKIIDYGNSLISRPSEYNSPISCGTFFCGYENHLCPDCNEFNLEFDRSGLLMD